MAEIASSKLIPDSLKAFKTSDSVNVVAELLHAASNSVMLGLPVFHTSVIVGIFKTEFFCVPFSKLKGFGCFLFESKAT